MEDIKRRTHKTMVFSATENLIKQKLNKLVHFSLLLIEKYTIQCSWFL